MRTPVLVNYRGRIVEAQFTMEGGIWIWLDPSMARRFGESAGQHLICSALDSVPWLMKFAVKKDESLLFTLLAIIAKYPRQYAEKGYSAHQRGAWSMGWILEYRIKHLGYIDEFEGCPGTNQQHGPWCPGYTCLTPKADEEIEDGISLEVYEDDPVQHQPGPELHSDQEQPSGGGVDVRNPESAVSERTDGNTSDSGIA